MPKKRTIKITKTNGANYLIEGVPLFYFYAFLKKSKCDIVVFDDIPYRNEDDWGHGFKFKELQPFNKSIKKVCKSGTDIIIGQKKGNQALILDYSQREVFLALNNGEAKMMQGVYAYFDTHDFDWQTYAYFENDNCYKEFLRFISKKFIIQNADKVKF